MGGPGLAFKAWVFPEGTLPEKPRSLDGPGQGLIAMSRRAQAKCLDNFCRYLSFVDTLDHSLHPPTL